MYFKQPSKKISESNKLYLSPKVFIDKSNKNNKVIATENIKDGETLIEEYPLINLFGEKIDDRDVLFLKKLILSSENELYPRDIKEFKRTRMTKKIFDKIKNTNKSLQKYFEQYDTNFIEHFYAKHIFNSFEGYEYGPLYLPNIAKLNHSCNPNTKFVFNKDTGIMRLIATRNIDKREEITDSYITNKKIIDHKEYLNDHYGFICNC
jgi:hypothetical protein